MTRYLFRNATILDAERGDYLADGSVLVEGDRILEVGGADVQASDAQSFDLHGMTLMPGLIDAHVHVTAVTADLAALAEWSPAYVTARAARVLAGMRLSCPAPLTVQAGRAARRRDGRFEPFVSRLPDASASFRSAAAGQSRLGC